MVKKLTSIVLSLSIVATIFAGVSFNAFADVSDNKGNTVTHGAVGAYHTTYGKQNNSVISLTNAGYDPTKSLIRDTANTDAKVYYYVSSTETNVASSYTMSSTNYSTVYDEPQLLPKGDGIDKLTGIEEYAFTNGTMPTISDTNSTGARQIIPTKLARSMFVTQDNGTFNGLIDDESKQYVQINFKLDAKATIDSFVTTDSLNRNANYAKYRNTYGHFKVYVADTEEGLWNDSNCVADVTNDTVGDDYEYLGVNLANPVQGSWVGLRIIKAYASLDNVAQCTTSNLQMRVAHFGVHGTYVNTATEGTVVTATKDAAVSAIDDIVVSDPVIAYSNRVDKNGNKAGTATLTATKKATTGGYDYIFKGWYKGDETEPTSTDATFVYDLANGNADFVAKYDVTEEVITHTVSVKIYSQVVGTYEVAHGETFDREAAKADIMARYPEKFPDGVGLYIKKGNSDSVTQDMELGTYYTYRTRFYGVNNQLIKEDWIGAGGAVTAPEVPEVEGKKFIGWDKEIVAANAPADYYAQYENVSNENRVTHGTVGAYHTAYTAGTSKVLPALSSAGYDPTKSLIKNTSDSEANVYYYVSSAEENPTVAANTKYTPVYGERTQVSGAGVNRLTGVEEYTFKNGTAPEATIYSTEKTDNREIIPTKLSRGMFIEYDKDGELVLVDDEDRQYVQINFKLDAEATINSFVTTDSLNRNATYAKYKNTYGHFKVYVADTEDGLWDESNCVAEVRNDTVGDNYEYLGVNLANPVQGSWVGLKIIKAYASKDLVAQCDDTNLQMRVAHFGVHGTYVNPASADVVNNVSVETSGGTGEADVSAAPAFSGKCDANGNYPYVNVEITADEYYKGSNGKFYEFEGWFDGETEVTTETIYVYNPFNGAKTFTAKYKELALTSSKYVIKGEYIKIVKGDTAATVAAGFDQDKNNIIIRNNGANVQYSALVDSGMTVEFYAVGEKADSKNIVIRGDYDGEGGVTVTDISKAIDVMVDGATATEDETFRFDDGDGRLTVTDIINARKAILLGE